MTKTNLAVVVFSFLILESCKYHTKQEKNTEEINTETTFADSIAKVVGTYKASLPGANSVMEIELILNKDNTFVKNTTYVDKGNAKGTDKGTFKLENNLVILDLDSTKNITKYKIGDGFIQQLDMDGKEITGKNAEIYTYKKIVY